jgi:hypothetical protein
VTKSAENTAEQCLHVTRVTRRSHSVEHFCPVCHRPSGYLREGVRLTKLKARIFDLIEDRPGITNKELCALLYPSVNNDTLTTTRAHIGQIREMLIGSGVTIIGKPGYGYRVEPEA